MVANRGSRHRFSEEGSTMTESMSQAREYVSRGYQQAEEMVARNPMSAVLVSFGIGLGVGVLIGSSMAMSQRSFGDLTTTEKAQRLGQQVLDMASRMLPETISSRLPG